MTQTNFVGIDYGSKLAGTTVVAYFDAATEQVHFRTAAPKKDADAFLLTTLAELRPALVFLDAPLSLPAVYTGQNGGKDYFYRAADRQLRAMSPMFLGGLTARAMQLKNKLQQDGITVFETYPARHAQRFSLKTLHYKQQLEHLPAVLDFLRLHLPFVFEAAAVRSWHQVDALLAFYTGVRFAEKTAEVFGDADEGQIWV
jgi:uncharacterized protein